MTCARGVRGLTRNTPGLERPASRNSPMSWHRPEIVGHKNSTLFGGDRQKLRIRNPLKLR
jgi:hypothetical protein